ncbi:MAG: hypothetical protein MSJ26_03885 [Oscillospiraceae bacterium]|nr:hypothetical protein [Oscillospiraceae bacterium]
MKKHLFKRILSAMAAGAMTAALMSGCAANSGDKEDKDTISVYLWTTAMYEKYAPYQRCA